MVKINNILIIGITGNGKSALASLLANNNEFGASGSGTSKTKHFQVSEEPFEYRGKQYRLIDNIGFGDSGNISEEEIFLEIGEGIYSAKEGINQVLFVFGGKFGPEQIESFNKFKKFVSGGKINEIAKLTTLVRTSFFNFKDQKLCEEDRKSLRNENNKELQEAINSCNKIIYIDNPPIPKIDPEEVDENDVKEANRIKEKQEDSRKIVLDHLTKNCPNVYKIGEWDGIYSIVSDYIEQKENSSTKEKELSKLRDKAIKDIRENLIKGLQFAVIEQK